MSTDNWDKPYNYNLSTRLLKLIFMFFISTFISCKSSFNMKTEKRNFIKAENIFNKKYKSNGNAFLFSVGTIGYKYIWTFSDDKNMEVNILDLSGKLKKKLITQKNWSNENILNLEGINCPVLIDGDIIKIKIAKEGKTVIDKTLNYEVECLKSQENESIKQIISDIKLVKGVQ